MPKSRTTVAGAERSAAEPTTTRKSRRTRRSGADASGAGISLYSQVTARIVAELEVGRVPWVQPWRTGRSAGVALPRNAATGRAYSGINVLVLWSALAKDGWPSHHWLTFRQALGAGGAVRKGERGTSIVYTERFVPESEKTRARDTGEEARGIAFLKRFTVFNVAQVDGLGGLAPDPAPLAEREIVPVGDALVEASGVDFRVGGGEAFYSPSHDFVQVPPQPAFFHQIDWYRTVFHELAHATGHASRLDRDLSHRFGSEGYAREDLVAEMGSAVLCAALGIVPSVRHADYLGAWLSVLRGDERAIFRAASAASKAADWLLARYGAAAQDDAA